MPEGWIAPDIDIAADAYLIAIAPPDSLSGFTPNATVFVTRADFFGSGDEAMRHAFVDAYSLPDWSTLDENRARYQGFESACIRGNFRHDQVDVYTENRYVLAHHNSWTYLVQATFSTIAGEQPPSELLVDSLEIAFSDAPALG